MIVGIEATDDESYDIPLTSRTLENSSILEDGDDIAPIIYIYAPLENYLYGRSSPHFSCSIQESNFDSAWYSLNGGKNITYNPFTLEFKYINPQEWAKIGNGTVSIIFYANDTSGNVGSAEVTVRKDAFAPILNIHTPLENERFKKESPNFTISVVEETSVITWYTIENKSDFSWSGLTITVGGADRYLFSGQIGKINQSAWDKAPNGSVTIHFYAMDEAWNHVHVEINVIKGIPSFPTIFGINIFFLLGVFIITSITLGIISLILHFVIRKRESITMFY